MRTADFDFNVPSELVAQTPAARRDTSRLFVLHRNPPRFEHRQFTELVTYLQPGNVLVLNNSRVIPARLRSINTRSGGRFELLLLEEVGLNDWWAMLRPGKRARVGTRITIQDHNGASTSIEAEVIAANEEGHRRVIFSATSNILEALDEIGEVPLPPYIERSDLTQMNADRERYQTVFAQAAGSVAAPTAGLHFTQPLLDELRQRGVHICFVTLHVGLGTFAPVKAESLSGHTMHEERYELSEETAQQIRQAKLEKRRVVAVGTTSLRVLESVAQENGGLITAAGRNVPRSARSGSARTRIFIYPPYDFKVVDALLTNFHLPRSTLVMLVSAFASPGKINGRELILSAYAEAVHRGYRFYSYGDAMLIT